VINDKQTNQNKPQRKKSLLRAGRKGTSLEPGVPLRFDSLRFKIHFGSMRLEVHFCCSVRIRSRDSILAIRR